MKDKNTLCYEICLKMQFRMMLIYSYQNRTHSFSFTMQTQIFNDDLFTSQNSLFQPFTSELGAKIENEKLIIESQFSIKSQLIRLELYPSILKMTFLSTRNTQSLLTYCIGLDYTIKATELTQKIDGSITKEYGISIFKDKDQSYAFLTSDEQIINRWMHELSKLIVLVGFSNKFKPLKYIGRGQFGQVWEVERLADGTKFAAKIIDKDICFGQVNGRQALYNEIQILKRLNHPNIVHLESIYESEKSIYIVQQYLEGEILSDFIKNNKECSSTFSDKCQKQHNVKIMKHLLKAVDYLHKSGIYHRDLKPGNIIINRQDWMPYIFDFGLSEFTEHKEHLFQCCGSPGYMAPQIFSNLIVQDLKNSDVFSLGAIFYMLLTQQPLFNGNSAEQIIQQTKNCKKVVSKKIKSFFNGAEAKLLQQMLEQDPEKRISAEEALTHDFFLEFSYNNLQLIRKSVSEGDYSSKYSLRTDNYNNKLQELLCESAIFIENKFNFECLLNEQEKLNEKCGRNIVTPSPHFAQKVKRRLNRYMSEQNIEVDFESSKKVQKSTWSGKWKKIKTLQQIIWTGNFWHVKDLIFEKQ